MSAGTRPDDLDRIRTALARAERVLRRFEAGAVDFERKAGGSPVTEADHAVNDVLLEALPRDGEGWLSEETADNPERLGRRRVWIVDPLDGTKEFVHGIPEWVVSVGLVEDGLPVAGGILNPSTGQWFLGAAGSGVTLNGEPVRPRSTDSLDGASVLASRSETRRGEWERWDGEPFKVVPCGSVAYKLALVAAGLADATWTLVPKHEWDVAAGAALVIAAGGAVFDPAGAEVRFNLKRPKLTGLVATGPGLSAPVARLLGHSRV